MKRTRVRLGRGVVLVAAIIGLIGGVGRAAGSGGSDEPEPSSQAVAVRTHLVRPGETLWAMARRVVGPQGDPRPVVEEIRSLNGLGPEPLGAGARILVPD